MHRRSQLEYDLRVTDGFVRPFLKILFSLLAAFVGSVFGSFAAGFLASMLILVFAGAGRIGAPITASHLLLWLEASTFYTLGYGMFGAPVAIALLLTCGLPAALIGWKLRLIRWWTCVMVGAIGGSLSIVASAWVFVDRVTQGILSSAGYLPAANQTLVDLVSLWVLGVSGAVGGLCFWLTLRWLRFPDIHEPTTSQDDPSQPRASLLR